MRRLLLIFFALIGIVSLLMPAIVTTQSVTGTITGTIKDPNGAVVVGAQVAIRNETTGETRQATTDNEGRFKVERLAPGRYQVSVTRSGFKVAEKMVVVEGTRAAALEIKLEIAETRAEVTTTAKGKGKNQNANTDPVYVQLRSAKLSGEHLAVQNLTLKRDTATIQFKEGEMYFLAPVEGKVTGAVFIGQGEFQMAPVPSYEQRQLSILTGTPTITEKFSKMVLRFTDGTYEELKKAGEPKTDAPNSSASSALEDNRKMLRKGRIYSRGSVAVGFLRYNLDERILIDVLSPGQGGLFQAYFDGKQYGDALFGIDPLGAPFVTPEEVVLVNFSQGALGVWVACHLQEHYRTPAFSDENHQLVDLEHHKITATTKGKRLDATVETRFKALVDGVRVIPFELFSQLRVQRVVDGKGRELSFVQEDKDDDADFAVILAEGLKKGEVYTLTFEYGGDDAVIDSGGGNFTLAARSSWYPNSYFGDRATYEMTLRTPKGLTMVATGQPQGESEESGYLVSRWKSDIPLAVAGFNYGKFKKSLSEEEKTKYKVETYANTELPDDLKDLQRQIEDLERRGYRTGTTLGALNTVSMMDKARDEARVSIGLYSSYFGELPYGRLAMTQQPFPNFGQAWPMLVYMPITAFLDSTVRHQLGLDSAANFFKYVAAHEVAHQWWGHIIGWKSYRDQWMSEGFASASASIFAQLVYKNDKFIEVWKDEHELITAKNTQGRRPSEVGSVYMGYRLDTAKTGSVTRAMIYPKGAFILHMLRMMMFDNKGADEKFKVMMQDFVKTHFNQNVSTEDFKRIVEKHMTPEMDLDNNKRMDWFFNEWVYGTEVPRYQLDYTLTAGGDGKTQLKGTLTQSEVSPKFKMRVPIYLDFDGKIVRLGAGTITGNSSIPLDVQLPQKPKRVLVNAYYDVLAVESVNNGK